MHERDVKNSIISIIVPVFHVERYLNKCINSIVCQTFSDIEIILVDDGSSDYCGEMCDEWAKKDSRIYVIHKENGGLSDARNVGIELTVSQNYSEWVAFVDGDDFIHSEFLRVLYSLVTNYKTKCALCSIEKVYNYENSDSDDSQEKLFSPDDLYGFSQEKTQYHFSVVSSCAKLYHISLLKDIRFPVGRLHEDRFTTHKLLFQCDKIAVTSRRLYKYYQSENSIMRSGWTPRRYDDFDALNQQLEFFKTNGFNNAYRATQLAYIQVLNLQIDDIKNSPFKNRYYHDLIKRLQTAVRECKKTGIIGSIFACDDYYYNLYPFLYSIITKARVPLRMLKSQQYRQYYKEKIRLMIKK